MKLTKLRVEAFIKIFKPCFLWITSISLLLVMTGTRNAEHAISMIIPALIISIITTTIAVEFLLRAFRTANGKNTIL